MSPLNELVKKVSTFHWDSPQQKSFADLKRAPTTAPVLQFPNYEDPFTVYSDASLTKLGAVLMQPDRRGKLDAIAYASRNFNRAERSNSVTHLESLAEVWAFKKFRDIVLYMATL